MLSAQQLRARQAQVLAPAAGVISARLATVGEMASLLSHELNQPLAAIASYASGSLNLISDPAPDTPTLIKQALERIAEQAERAGRVIKSVHDFVRRRDQQRAAVAPQALLDAVPRPDPDRIRRPVIGGEVPSLLDPPPGCRFHTRCPHALPRCRVEVPLLRQTGPGHFTACHLTTQP